MVIVSEDGYVDIRPDPVESKPKKVCSLCGTTMSWCNTGVDGVFPNVVLSASALALAAVVRNELVSEVGVPGQHLWRRLRHIILLGTA